MTGSARFIQIHWLSSYPATLLNRDDAGQAKRIPFGGTVRSRISSQCLKRHWRLAGQDGPHSAKKNPWALHHAGAQMGLRSKEVVERRILPAALDGLNVDQAIQDAVASELLKGLYGKDAADSKKRQALLFGEPEIDYFTQKARAALQAGDADAAAKQLSSFFDDEKKNMKALKRDAGLESALWGRMVTSDTNANRDAAVHVAHALTVHAIERELDFMTVVDDLKAEDSASDSGAAGVFDMELASGVYYGYVVVDVPLLVSNLTGDAAVAAKVVEHLVHLIAEVTPGAKKGSTAPYTFAEFMLIETGDRQPRTLANAFRKAIALGRGDVAENAVEALAQHLLRMDDAYGASEQRRQLSTLDTALPDVERATLDSLAAFAAAAVGKGEA